MFSFVLRSLFYALPCAPARPPARARVCVCFHQPVFAPSRYKYAIDLYALTTTHSRNTPI